MHFTLLPLLALSSLSLVSARSLPLRQVEERNMMAEATTTMAAMAKQTAAAEGMMGGEKKATTTMMAAEAAKTTEMAAHQAAMTTEVAKMAEMTTTMMAHEAMTTAVHVPPAAAVTTAAAVMYGSGSMNPEFQNCIQQCQAQFGMGGGATPPPTQTGSSGSSKTHTVIVAPTQGVLKFVPFAIDAAPGDEVVYKWGANVHTVTKGSGSALCNASKDASFTSGRQNLTFEFKKTVNDTKPLWVFCGVPTHCQKGMFAGVNIKKTTPSSENATGSFDAMVTTLGKTQPKVAAMWNESMSYVANNTFAAAWGKDLDTSELEAWAVMPFIQNVLETRMDFAANPAAQLDGFSLDTMVSPPRLASAAGIDAAAPATVSAGATATATVAAGTVATGAAGTTAGNVSAEGVNSGAASSMGRPATLLLLAAAALPVLHFLL